MEFDDTQDGMEFVVKTKGISPIMAFRHSEVSTIKEDFIQVQIDSGSDPYDFAANLINSKDKRISDVEGPAGCIDITSTTYGIMEEPDDDERVYLFFGWTYH